MSKILMFAVAGAGLGVVLILFNLIKKGGKVAAKLPLDYLLFFLIYALLGSIGFSVKGQIAENPVLIGILLALVSLMGGLILTYNLYEKWEWGISATFGKKLRYLVSIMLLSIVAFTLVFLLSEHRGIPKKGLSNDIVWWLAAIIFVMILPLLIKYLHQLWNDIPKISQIKPIFRLPLGTRPPFIEPGGITVRFTFHIPLAYHSDEFVDSKVAVPINVSLADAFHYKLHDHNVEKRFSKKIEISEGNRREKVYGWCFYQTEEIWWGLWQRKNYFNPGAAVGTIPSNNDVLFVERVKIWEQ